MNGDLRLTCDVGAGTKTMEWEIEKMTDGPDGQFILSDSNGTPRLILTADELAELQRGDRQ